MAAVKKQRGADPSRTRRVQIARVLAAATGAPDLNRAQRRAIARQARGK